MNVLVGRRAFAAAVSMLLNLEQEKVAPSLSFERAIEILDSSCFSSFLRGVRESGNFLYRGESNVDSPMILDPEPDLLLFETYGNGEAVDFFVCLEERLVSSTSTVRPSNGHIGTPQKGEAEKWGSPVSVWPLESTSTFDYVWPKKSDQFFPGDCNASRPSPRALRMHFELEKK
mmetsp:Transcript_25784/g.59253  ORF Transcript_25784/g.59253 Transcript_25784/m.59253 type:complete len:174 (+) Transcript_25784:51-572(+)